MSKFQKPADAMIAGHHSKELLHYLLNRRSVPRKCLVQPGPSDNELKQILEGAARVSDHGKLFPFWFIVLKGEVKDKFRDEVAKIIAEDKPEKDQSRHIQKADKYLSAPMIVVVVSRLRECKIPAWEQFMTAGAACQNFVLAANASGYGVNWLTEWMTYDVRVRKILRLDEHDNIAGFMHVGTALTVPDDRPRPDMKELVTYWDGESTLIKNGQVYFDDKQKSNDGSIGFAIPAGMDDGFSGE